MNIRLRRNAVLCVSSFFALSSSTGGCARRSDGGGLDLPGGGADLCYSSMLMQPGYKQVQLRTTQHIIIHVPA